MEASALTSASHSGLLARRSPLLRLQSDDRLVALLRDGNDRAFEVLFDRYQVRLLAFCRHLLGSMQDAEDVLQEVFASAHGAMLADRRPVNARPWLYRIARNRCLNFLRRPTAEGQDSMDVHPHQNGATTLERVQRREELREIVADVQELPETQRTALVLREIDDLSYTEIAQAMGTTLPAIKSLLVRARVSLAEASEARMLTCDEVRLELAEVVEGLSKLSAPARRHVRECARCGRYRTQLRATTKGLSGLAPLGLLALLRKLAGAKLGGGQAAGGSAGSAAGGGTGGAAGAGGAGGAGAAGAGSAGAVGAGGAAAGGSGAALGGMVSAAGSTVGGLGGALAGKAAVGMATAALITAGAVGVERLHSTPTDPVKQTAPTAVMNTETGWHPQYRSTADRHSHSTGPRRSPAPEESTVSDPTPPAPPTSGTDTQPTPEDPPAPTPTDVPTEDVPSDDTSTTDSSTTDSSGYIGDGTSTDPGTATGEGTVTGSSGDTGATTTDPVAPPPEPVPVDPSPPPSEPTQPTTTEVTAVPVP